MLWFAKFESVIPVQHEFRRKYCPRQPEDKSVRRWYDKFGETGSVRKEILLGSLGALMKM
jgi:hypothetical protein